MIADLVLNRNPFLVGGLVIAGSVWIGSFVCLTLVSSVARSALEPTARVEFFRVLGRRYGIVGTVALAGVIGAGLAMTWPPAAWDRRGDALGALVLAAVVLTVVGVRQARAMTRLRRASLAKDALPELADRVHRRATLAAGLRALIGLDALVAIVVFAWIVGT